MLDVAEGAALRIHRLIAAFARTAIAHATAQVMVEEGFMPSLTTFQ